VGTGSVASPTASAMGMGTDGATLVPTGRSTSSASVPLASQAGHQPIHLGASAPQSLQR
jgi:hypothetical protein